MDGAVGETWVYAALHVDLEYNCKVVYATIHLHKTVALRVLDQKHNRFHVVLKNVKEEILAHLSTETGEIGGVFVHALWHVVGGRNGENVLVITQPLQ